jgi:hypothetical protein
LGAALGHLGEAVAEQVELLVDRLLGRQLLVGIALLGDQLTAYLFGADAGEEPLGLELGVGLASISTVRVPTNTNRGLLDSSINQI